MTKIHFRYSLLALFLMILLFSASCSRTSEYKNRGMWFDSGREIDEDLTDVFYIVSANIISSGDSINGRSYNAILTEEEKKILDGEINFVNNIFCPEFNFFSPYYHQFTFESMALDKNSFVPIYNRAETDVNEAFNYYIRNLNNGRKFILAGFSQGAMIIPSILKNLTDDQYSRFVAAYMMGGGLTEEDLECPRIIPANDSESMGITVSFNSVSSVGDIWDFVTGDAAVCTNPTTWTTDSTVGELVFNGDSLKVAVDTTYNVLIVSGTDPERYHFAPLDSYCTRGNLHHYDILFYNDLIKENAILRSYKANKTKEF